MTRVSGQSSRVSEHLIIKRPRPSSNVAKLIVSELLASFVLPSAQSVKSLMLSLHNISFIFNDRIASIPNTAKEVHARPLCAQGRLEMECKAQPTANH